MFVYSDDEININVNTIFPRKSHAFLKAFWILCYVFSAVSVGMQYYVFLE
jgi:hypothetical protein